MDKQKEVQVGDTVVLVKADGQSVKGDVAGITTGKGFDSETGEPSVDLHVRNESGTVDTVAQVRHLSFHKSPQSEQYWLREGEGASEAQQAQHAEDLAKQAEQSASEGKTDDASGDSSKDVA